MANITRLKYILILIFYASINKVDGTEPVCAKLSYYEQLMEKMVRMEFSVEKMRDEMISIREAVKEELRLLQTERESFKAMFSALNDECKTVKATVETEKENMRIEFAVLKDKNKQAMKSQSDVMGKNFNQQASQIARMSEDLRFLENTTVQKLTDLAVTPVVLFRARTLADLTLASSQIMIFTKTIKNEGQGYDNTTGKFTAPISGLYLLTAQLCTYKNKFIVYHIVMDGEIQTIGTAYGDAGYSCHSVNVVVKMHIGMKAWIQSANNYKEHQLLEDKYRWNIFSGFLINKLYL